MKSEELAHRINLFHRYNPLNRIDELFARRRYKEADWRIYSAKLSGAFRVLFSPPLSLSVCFALTSLLLLLVLGGVSTFWPRLPTRCGSNLAQRVRLYPSSLPANQDFLSLSLFYPARNVTWYPLFISAAGAALSLSLLVSGSSYFPYRSLLILPVLPPLPSDINGLRAQPETGRKERAFFPTFLVTPE